MEAGFSLELWTPIRSSQEQQRKYRRKRKKVHAKRNKKTPQKFIEYAKDDLFNYDALNGHATLVKELYTLLDLELYYSLPRLTIGATIQALFEASIVKFFSITNRKKLIENVESSSHKTLIEKLISTQVFLAKSNGGRWYNNRPQEPSLTGVIVDIDINSCYGQGLKLQEYPLVQPVIIDL